MTIPHPTSAQGLAPIALITGGSRGLGRSAALHLARAGWDLAITYREQAADAAELVTQVHALGRRAVALPLDMAHSASFADFADRLSAALVAQGRPARIDALVNNAGMGVHAGFADTTEAEFDQLMQVHLKGVFFLTQRLLPLITDGGRILLVSSGLTRFSFPGYAAYAVMKGGIEVLTRYLAKELGPRGISVNTLAPGAAATDFGGGAVRDNAALNQALAAQTALGRVGQPDDMGAAVATLLSTGAGWINGQRIEASGGMLL